MGVRRGLLTRVAVLGLAGSGLTGFWLVAGPAAPAGASCAADPEQSLLQNAHVVAGTVVDTRTGFARLEVSEIWRGGPVGPLLWVQTAVDQPSFPKNLFEGVGSSADVTLTRGDRLVVGTDKEFRTGSCQVFTADDEALAGLRPAAVGRPVPNGAKGAERPIGVGKVIGWGLTALALASLLWVGLRPRPHPAGEAAPGADPDASAGGPDPSPGG